MSYSRLLLTPKNENRGHLEIIWKSEIRDSESRRCDLANYTLRLVCGLLNLGRNVSPPDL